MGAKAQTSSLQFISLSFILLDPLWSLTVLPNAGHMLSVRRFPWDRWKASCLTGSLRNCAAAHNCSKETLLGLRNKLNVEAACIWLALSDSQWIPASRPVRVGGGAWASGHSALWMCKSSAHKCMLKRDKKSVSSCARLCIPTRWPASSQLVWFWRCRLRNAGLFPQ